MQLDFIYLNVCLIFDLRFMVFIFYVNPLLWDITRFFFSIKHVNLYFSIISINLQTGGLFLGNNVSLRSNIWEFVIYKDGSENVKDNN